MGKGTARIADDGPRYAVEFTFCIGRNAEGVHTDMSKLKDVLLPACALGKSGYTLIEGDAGTDEIGNPEYSATIMKSYYIRSVKEAEIAAEEVKEFLGRVFAQMSQESVLLKFQTIDKKRRQSVATNNQLIEVADLNDIDATYFLPFTYRTDLS
ncbi:MAG: hypothetical protein SGI88_15230 [Candidatus Hydrogenedentes bacterium]|nr:hypothetical protein [Candidatus Hydrogenedentota bacterium]